MITQEDIVAFCSQYDYDIKIPRRVRWIDQKCAADVITIIADCICNYVSENGKNSFFTSMDIWHYEYAINNIEAIFKKPGVESKAAKNEYDKFFQQPMEMFAYAYILTKEKRGNRNYYRVNNFDILNYIALRERNALSFLQVYIEKVLKDSGIFNLFGHFLKLQTHESYIEMKEGFASFIIRFTKINGQVECNRIFIKVLNPLAYKYDKCGTEHGRMSSHKITYDMLMYNRNNFRDIFNDKPKGITRKEYLAMHPVKINDAYYKYQSNKAKQFLRAYNDLYRKSLTEYPQVPHIKDKAIHMHHIFPEAEFPEICYMIENIIALTPTQHLSYAHPNGKTQEIDEQYQHLLLLAKLDRIRENLEGNTGSIIYEFNNFLYVLHIGFDNDYALMIKDNDFNSVINLINRHYSNNPSNNASEELGIVADKNNYLTY